MRKLLGGKAKRETVTLYSGSSQHLEVTYLNNRQGARPLQPPRQEMTNRFVSRSQIKSQR